MPHKHAVKVSLVFAMIFLMFPMIALAQPEYAEWGSIALEDAKAQYPDYNATDYAYQGKVFISDEREQFNFLITLEGDETKEVRVYVLVNPKTEQLIDVYFDEME
ncbi:DUF3889 domain-containing protein [Sediminibacillus dalangtanensis]|uniref:DUF3889 domain-containing protein n=1 Tax=Sediminibacillus dalangtanensis TaxID=2729421 RepID=A0ABX7VPQ4_9BACI|nr:DUF3889 domain-containing protein [Sediminibacillus dalangtanensis]QTM98834.1 DUF3889 domain-containing protein [Sediminibacillus dalangtanensis]